MNRLGLHRRTGRGGRRRLAAVAAVLGATLLACSAPAYAQTPPDSGAVDQYVEDVPTAGGSTHPGKNPGKKDTIKPSVAAQIDSQGGSDAPVLTEVATSSDYGAGPKLPDAPKPGVRDGEISNAAPEADVSSSALASSAVSAVQGAETARLVGFLVVLFGISVATLTAAALRQRRPTQA
jgi:hypothetical protein